MAEKMTRKQALEFAISNLENEEVVEVLDKMLQSISKPRKAVVSKARKVNENLATTIAKMCNGEVTTKDVVALGLPEITTTQKAAAVLRIATEMGLFEKVVDGKKVSYRKCEPTE